MCWLGLITPARQVIKWVWETANEHDQKFCDVGIRWNDQTKYYRIWALESEANKHPTGTFAIRESETTKCLSNEYSV